MIRLGYTDCATCHVSPQGGGLLTSYGKGVDAAQSLRVYEVQAADTDRRPPRCDRLAVHERHDDQAVDHILLYSAQGVEGAQALVISEDAFTFSNRAQIVALGAAQGMIDISAFREFVVAGGVMSYGANAAERLRQQARYAARLARGVAPGDLPIDQPTRFEFVVNVKAARALGVTIAPAALLVADEVIR